MASIEYRKDRRNLLIAVNNTVNLIVSLITAYPCAASVCKTASGGSNGHAGSSYVKTVAFFRPIALFGNGTSWYGLLALAPFDDAPIK